MKKHRMNYETLLKVTKALSMSKDPKEIIKIAVHSVKETLNMKGCALYLVNAETNEFELAASHGLSEKYLGKGPVSVSRPISKSLAEEPVAIYDTQDDPRVQYVEEAKEEGIAEETLRRARRDVCRHWRAPGTKHLSMWELTSDEEDDTPEHLTLCSSPV